MPAPPNKKNWYRVCNLADDTAEVMIYDDIGAYGVSAAQFRTDFNAIKAAKIDLRINSYGGECADAVAICTAIREHPAEVTAHVDGIAASAASIIACACDSVRISKNAWIMIHNPSGGCWGYASDMRKTADLLDTMGKSIGEVYVAKTGKSAADVAKAMDAETWFDAEQAKEFGLADEIKDPDADDDDEDVDEPAGNSAPAIDLAPPPLLITKFKNVPERVRRMVAAASGRTPPAQTPAPKMEKSMLNVIHRDGKQFVAIAGVEHEINAAAPATIPGKSEADLATAVNAAKEQAIKDEQAYRTMFNTAISAGGLTGSEAEDFQKNFYAYGAERIPEKQVKWLAQKAVANRATAIGEGSGGKEPTPGENANDPANKAMNEAGKRFDEERSVRRMYAVTSNDPASAEWKSARGRHVAAARRRFLADPPKAA